MLGNKIEGKGVGIWQGGLGHSVEEKIENPERKYLTFQMAEIC